MIKAPKIHTDLLWDLSFLFVGLAVVYFIFVFYYRNRLSARAKREKQRKRELSPMVSEFLFYEEEASKDEKSNYVNLKIEIRQLLKDDFNRKILSEVLLDLRKDLAGDTQKRLFKLYQDLGLHNDAFEKLKSWRWERISKAILDLTQMQVAEAYGFVTKFINDKRPTIRKQAEIAVVTLKQEGINYFLDTTKYKISEWQQLKLLDVLRNDDDYQPPRFKAWLTSTNRHVVLFALRLIKFYNQNDADAALIELVKHKNNQIKAEAIGCITEFYIVAALPTLKLVFWKSSTDIKISILNSIGSLGEESDIEFLQLIEKKEANFSVRSKAHSSINAIMPDSIMPSKGLVNTTNYRIPDDIEIKEEEEIEVEVEVEEERISPETIVEPEEMKPEHHVTEEISEALIDQPEEIINTEAKHDTMEENQEPAKQEIPKPKVDEVEPQENETLSFDFLPLVVQEVGETETSASEEEDAGVALKGIVVNFEEIIPKDGDSSIELNEIIVNFEEVASEEELSLDNKTMSLEIQEEELAFLPIVTEVREEASAEKTEEDQANSTILIQDIEVLFEEVQNTFQNQEVGLSLDFSEFNTTEILDAQVIYDELTASSIEIPNSDIQEQTDPYFLSPLSESPPEDTMDVESNANKQSLQSYDDMGPQDEQKFKKIIKDLIDFNEQKQSNESTKAFQDWPLLEFGDEFVNTGGVSQTDETNQDVTETDSYTEVEETVQNEPTIERPIIPSAILGDDILDEIVLYKENTEESRMQLLDDIAEMGDQRELPLLNELLINEKYKTVKDRVKRLIEQFSDNEERPKQDTVLKPFNVFEDLFRTCDTEAKLILMDEIVAVGDEGEINFLEGLLEDDEKEISNKAARILEELKAKLSNSNQRKTAEIPSNTINQPTVSEMEVLVEEETLAEYDSLMEELQIQPAQASGIFDVAFELTEPLTTTIENSTIDNNSTEKSDDQESFLGQLYTKIIDKLNG